MTNISEAKKICNPEKWGLPLEAMKKIGVRFDEMWKRYEDLFKTKTRDTSKYGKMYLRSLLTMETKRNYREIEKKLKESIKMGKRYSILCLTHLGIQMQYLNVSKKK